MSGSRGRGSSNQRTVRRGSAIASSSSRMRSTQGERAEVQRIAPIFGQTRRAIQEGQEAAIVEMMAGQQSSPASASTLTAVEVENEGMVGPVDQEAFVEETEARDVGREEVVGGSQEVDLFSHEDTDLDYDEDDPGSDPPYVPILSPEGSEEEEEEVVVVQRSSMTDRGSHVSSVCGSQEEPQPAASAATTTTTTTTTSTTTQPQTSGRQQQQKQQQKQAPPSSRKGKFTSQIWNHFTVSSLDETFAVCKHCKEAKTRGKNPARLGTSCLQAHLKRHHRPLYEEFVKVRDGARGHPSAAASRPAAATAGARPRTAPSSAVSRALPTTELQGSQSSVASSAPSTAHSSASQAAGKRQSQLSETFPGVTKARRRK